MYINQLNYLLEQEWITSDNNTNVVTETSRGNVLKCRNEIISQKQFQTHPPEKEERQKVTYNTRNNSGGTGHWTEYLSNKIFTDNNNTWKII